MGWWWWWEGKRKIHALSNTLRMNFSIFFCMNQFRETWVKNFLYRFIKKNSVHLARARQMRFFFYSALCIIRNVSAYNGNFSLGTFAVIFGCYENVVFLCKLLAALCCVWIIQSTSHQRQRQFIQFEFCKNKLSSSSSSSSWLLASIIVNFFCVDMACNLSFRRLCAIIELRILMINCFVFYLNKRKKIHFIIMSQFILIQF